MEEIQYFEHNEDYYRTVCNRQFGKEKTSNTSSVSCDPMTSEQVGLCTATSPGHMRPPNQSHLRGKEVGPTL